mmetsp:Transcript_45373/g.145561  ORF Transcript_45373/g.145561 Transcript_45373/m.145561 type:complete len:156 (-) Transcript_45373:17-484(-)
MAASARLRVVHAAFSAPGDAAQGLLRVHDPLEPRTCAEEYLSGNARPPLNTEARDFFLEDPAAFAAKAAECAQQSLTNVYQNTKGSSLQFTKGPVEAHEKILESLRATDSSYALEDRKAMFVDWFCNHYAHQRTQVGVEGHQVETILLPSAEKER